MTITLQQVDVRAVSRHSALLLAGLMDELGAEAGHPPLSVDRRVAQWTDLNPGVRSDVWLARRDRVLVGFALVRLSPDGSERHLLGLRLGVRAGERRRGVGTALLHAVRTFAQCEGKTWLTFTTSGLPDGLETFLRSLGAEVVQESLVYRLPLSDVRLERLEQFTNRLPHGDFEVHMWRGAYPEGALPDLARLFEERGPMDGRREEPLSFTPEKVRRLEARELRAGRSRRVAVAVERRTGRVVGMSRAWWEEGGAVVFQHKTAVLPEYRRRGLAGAMKAALLREVAGELPGTVVVETGVARSNLPMRSLNEALGFQVVEAQSVWHLPVAQDRVPPALP